MSRYLNTALEHQSEVDKGLTTTHEGGEAYAVDAFKRARRFMILGAEGGSFYVRDEKALTVENIKSIKDALDADGRRLIDMIVQISNGGLSPKQDPALLALAMSIAYENPDKPKYAEDVRSYARQCIPLVARTSTALFHFVAFADQLRGWGTCLRKGVGNWYLEKDAIALANQVTKYQQRDGWSHADLLRLSHPVPNSPTKDAIFKYAVDGVLPPRGEDRAIEYLRAVEEVKDETDTNKIIDYIEKYRLPREVIPTRALNEASVWNALLFAGQGMPMTAMIRNLATMTRVGLLSQGSEAARFVSARLENSEVVLAARVHPIDMLKAKLTYEGGRSVRGSSQNTWDAVRSVIDALESGFYVAFGNVEPTGKRILMAYDVSSSMTWGERYSYGYSYENGTEGLAGVIGLSPRIAVACLGMVTARVERDYEILGFEHQLVDLDISRHDSLQTAMEKVQRTRFGGTDCSLPFQYAIDSNKQFDAFMVFTDSETQRQNPSKVMREYRKKSGIHDAKLIVNGMTANQFSIADPKDPNMLDVVGFDSSAPAIMSAFIRGEV